MKHLSLFVLLTFSISLPNIHAKPITILGTGYVGLVTGSCLAHLGNEIICADINIEKIDLLNNNQIPIYEKGLKKIIIGARNKNLLSFTSDPQMAIRSASTIFLAVPTPMSTTGAADISAIISAIDMIAPHINEHNYKLIITKSTVPVGTNQQMQKHLIEHHHINPDHFDIVSNPEFLREGCAVNDFLHPDRIVVGAENERAHERLRSIYKPLTNDGVPYVATNLVTAEMIKYAANTFLATKISFINEIARIADAYGADTEQIATGIGLDKRISPYFLKPGPGFGGSCFPKDVQALLHIARKAGLKVQTLKGSLRTNKKQTKIPVKKLLNLLHEHRSIDSSSQPLAGKTIAVLGCAFKAHTDDIRESPAIITIQQLLKHGAHIRVYDPKAMRNMQNLFPHITYCNNAYDALTNADALIIMTEWPEFAQLDIARIGNLMKHKYVIDTRNVLDNHKLIDHEFIADNIGRSYIFLKELEK